MAETGAAFNLQALRNRAWSRAAPTSSKTSCPSARPASSGPNWAGSSKKSSAANAAQEEFEAAMGAKVADEIALYEQSSQASINASRQQYCVPLMA